MKIRSVGSNTHLNHPLELASPDVARAQKGQQSSQTADRDSCVSPATDSSTDDKMLIRSCGAPHEATLPRAHVELCARIAEAISGKSLRAIPEVCVPATLSDFARALAKDRHGPADDTGACLSPGQLPDFAYLFTSHQVVKKTTKNSSLAYWLGENVYNNTLVHEMVHAIQAEHHPHILEAQRELGFEKERRGFQLFEGALQVFLGDGAAQGQRWGAMKAVYEQYKLYADTSTEIFCRAALLEGHAMWVEQRARKTVFPGPSGFGALRACALNFLIHPLYGRLRSVGAYSIGFRLVTEVEKLQAKLEEAPFFDSKNRKVTLRKDLKNHGLMDYLFENPMLVKQLAPYALSGWAWKEMRERISIDPLEKTILEFDDHVQL